MSPNKLLLFESFSYKHFLHYFSRHGFRLQGILLFNQNQETFRTSPIPHFSSHHRTIQVTRTTEKKKLTSFKWHKFLGKNVVCCSLECFEIFSYSNAHKISYKKPFKLKLHSLAVWLVNTRKTKNHTCKWKFIHFMLWV